MNKYVVKGLNSDRDVIVSVVCPVHDLPNIIDAVNNVDFDVVQVRVSYLDPDNNFNNKE